MLKLTKDSEVGPDYQIADYKGCTVSVSAMHENESMSHAFKDCEFSHQKLQGMQCSIDNGTAIHVSITITVYKDGANSEAHLGSCWDKDLFTMMKSGIHGYLPQMLEEAYADL